MRQAGPSARGGTAYLNLETGDCHGDGTSVGALVQGGVSRCAEPQRTALCPSDGLLQAGMLHAHRRHAHARQAIRPMPLDGRSTGPAVALCGHAPVCQSACISRHGMRCMEGLTTHASVCRVVLGLLHPLAHLRGSAVQALSAAGVHVDVLGQAGCSADPEAAEACLRACLQANEVRWHMKTNPLLCLRVCPRMGRARGNKMGTARASLGKSPLH